GSGPSVLVLHRQHSERKREWQSVGDCGCVVRWSDFFRDHLETPRAMARRSLPRSTERVVCAGVSWQAGAADGTYPAMRHCTECENRAGDVHGYRTHREGLSAATKHGTFRGRCSCPIEFPVW